MTMIDDLYLPDSKRLNVQVWGQAGSGKTFFLEHTLAEFLKRSKDKFLRILYISPKHEGILIKKKKNEPKFDLGSVEKSFRKNRLTVFYPWIEDLEGEVDQAINMVFDAQAGDDRLKAVIIIDDAQCFLSSRKAASKAHRRLALTGRSRNIRAIYVSHNIVFAKELEAQISFLIGFTNPLPLYYRSSMERFGFDPEPFAKDMIAKEYSFVWFNTRTREGILMEPLNPDSIGTAGNA